MFNTESSLQRAVVNYIKLKYPKARYCASLGGQYQKYPSQRRTAKETGYVKGFPDLQICEVKGKYHGLFIELKIWKNAYPSEHQKQWIKDLQDRGYCAEICKGFDECIDLIDKYFNLKQQ